MKKLFLTLIVAIATVCGFAQKAAVDKDSVNICFQLASKAAGEKATLIFSDGDDCVNIRLPEEQQRAVEEYLGVQGFPTFLLVAPDGNIASNKAPRPSSPTSVREAILQLLK